MQKSDLLEILRVLNETEQKNLLVFLSNAPKVRRECMELVQYVLHELATPDTENLKKENVYGKIFPGKAWVENKLPKLMGETLVQVRRFVSETMAIRQMTELQHQYYLQVFYQERLLEEKFWAAHKEIARSRLDLQQQTTQDRYTRFLAENQVYLFQSMHNKRKDDLNLKNVIEAWDDHYVVGRYWFLCLLLNQNLVAPLDLPFSQEPFLADLNAFRFKKFSQEPLGQLYHQAIDLLSNTHAHNNPDNLLNFIELLREKEAEIPEYQINLFELTASNYCIRRLNEGEGIYLKTLFGVLKARVDSGRMYIERSLMAPSEVFNTTTTEKKLISPSEFLNTTTTALRLQAFDWVKTFIENHKKRVLGVMPSEQYYEFARATYLFHTKDYQETCRILMTSDYADIQCKISGRILEIKALAEQFFREKADHRVGEYLEDRVEAAILFFFRLKDVEATKKKMGKRFADTMKRIIHAEGKQDLPRLEIILHDIPKAEFIAERQWLTRLVEDLIAQYRKK